jgi:hypothetical protein
MILPGDMFWEVLMARGLGILPGDIYLVWDCLLGFDDCEEYEDHTCKSRPCWVAEVDGDYVLVYPFPTRLYRNVGPIFEAGEGGLHQDSMLNVEEEPIWTSVYELGPYIGWLDPKDVWDRIEEWWENEEDDYEDEEDDYDEYFDEYDEEYEYY